MCADWKEPPDSATFAELNESRRIDSKGAVSFQGGNFESRVLLVEAALKFNPAIPETDRRRILHQAIFEAGKSQLTPTSILRVVRRLESGFLRRPFTNYVLVTALSLSLHPRRVLKRRVARTTMLFAAFMPNKYDRSPIENLIERYLVVPQPNRYPPILVNVRGRSEHEAYKSAINSIDLVRGIWNLFWNYQQGIRHSFERPRPVNRIVLEPIQTLHYPSGKLAVQSVWYDSGYVAPLALFSRSEDEMARMFAFEKDVKRRLHGRSRSESLVESAKEFLIHYCRSLDEWNLQSTFLKLWALLEMMTGTSPKEGSETTIRRAVSLFRNPQLHKAILAHLRDQRNRIVHQNESPDELEDAVYRLKKYVEVLLHLYLMNPLGFENLGKYLEFLSLPTDPSLLRGRIAMLRKAASLRGVT